jgi:hypothetical protein
MFIVLLPKQSCAPEERDVPYGTSELHFAPKGANKSMGA